jgi:hypothetical protein
MREVLSLNLLCKRLRHPWLAFAAILIVANLTGLSLPVLAETKQVRSIVNPDREQTFLQMMQQAESQAAQLIEQAFAESRSVTNVSVVILGERNGQQIPLLSSTVSRANWQKTPRIQAWAKYFGNASVALLGFAKLPAQPPVSAPAPASTSVTSETPSLQSPGPSALQPAPGISPDPAASPANSSPNPVKAPANSGFSPTRIRIQDDPGYRDD